MHRLHAYLLVVLASGFAAGCHSTLEAELDLGVDAGDEIDFGDADLSGADLTPCTPKIMDCSGLCGPIWDGCLGKNVQCGGCDNGTVCNLIKHVCEVPKTTCVELNAQCGTIRNSCGTRLSCPDCASNKECDPDTNSCVNCQNVTCAQMGKECGWAWLGCGNTANQTDCGACPAGANPVCNPYFNVCEPTCTPASAATLCAAAKTARNVECGIITDGCGGYVDCGGCQPGFACGAQGDPNRCEPKEQPTECIAAGIECGQVSSACGGKVDCGTCTPPDVCNPNGKCGPPCTPKTCTELGNPACGFVDDGCGAMKKCNDCAPGSTCLPSHTCCLKKTCAGDYAGKCGTALDDGCGGTIDCGCAPGLCTSSTPGTTGTCCVNTAKCAANACNTSVTDTCTGLPIPCTCTASQYCSGGTCVPKKTCADYMATGQDGKPCSNAGAFDDGTGKLLSCPCVGGRYCIGGAAPSPVVTGSTIGMCCTDTGACTMGGMQACNLMRTNSCTGATNTCGGCAANQYCNGSNLCVPDFTCASYGANGNAGNPCSNGPAPVFPRGDGTDLTCKCKAGGQCVNGMVVVSGPQDGSCCVNTSTCTAGSCNTSVVDSCTGATINCTCAANQFCNGTTCMPKNTCASLGKTGAQSSPCNDNNFYDDGTGTKLACKCSTAGGFTNAQCTGDSASMEGTCTCAPAACTDCTQNGTSNGCGGTKSCACAGGQTCYPPAGGANGCCSPKSCANLPAGVPAGACGTFNDGCGASFGCGCPANNPMTGLPQMNVQCVTVPGSNPAYGGCMCTPTPCTVLGAGTHPNDGCGHPITCGA